jgi:hypothetical protein
VVFLLPPVARDRHSEPSLATGALIGSILARMTDAPAPAIESVYAVVKPLNKAML